MKTRSALTVLQMAKLYIWMESNKAILPEKTAEELSSAASKALGFSVGYWTLQKMRAEMGYSPREANSSTPPQPLRHDHKIQVIAASLVSLFRQLGSTPSIELEHIAKGK